MSDDPVTAAATCRAGTAGRLARGGVTVVVAAFAASILPTDPVIGVMAAVVAAVAAIMTITGRCPADGLPPAEHPLPTNALGFADAREQVDLSTSTTTQNRSSHVRQ